MESRFIRQAEQRRGIMLIISGPSGAGKSTLCGMVRTILGNIHFSVSCTTRAPRPGERHGVEYYFLSREDFEQKIAAGEFIEHAEVFGNRYGTLRSEVLRHVEEGRDVLLDIDVQGALQIKNAAAADPLLGQCGEFIFIAPPSPEELEKRLRSRNTETEDVLQRRLGQARKEISFWREYDFLVINDEINRAVEDLKNLIAACRRRTKRITGGPWT